MANEILQDCVSETLVPYETAVKRLAREFWATPDEIAMWVDIGDLQAFDRYGRKTKRIPPSEMFFLQSELDDFNPYTCSSGRWLTYSQLIGRWLCGSHGQGEAYLKEFIQGRHSKWEAGWALAPLSKPGALIAYCPLKGIADDIERGMFQLKQVESVEDERPEFRPTYINDDRIKYARSLAELAKYDESLADIEGAREFCTADGFTDSKLMWDMLETARNGGDFVKWDYWFGLPIWTAKEACCLLHSIDPNYWDNPIPKDPSFAHILNDKRKQWVSDMIRLAEREAEVGLIRNKMPPSEWAEWAKNKGYWCKLNPEFQTRVVESRHHNELIEVVPNNATLTNREGTVTRPQIKQIFTKLTAEQWRGHFSRENINGLEKARLGNKGKPTYQLSEVRRWLESKALYKPAEIEMALRQYQEPNGEQTKPKKKKNVKPNPFAEFMPK